MTNELIGEMKLEDVNQAAQLEAMNFTMPFKEKDFEEVVNNENKRYIVIKIDEEIIAQAGMTIILGEAEINNVSVKDSYKNKGYGRLIMEELFKIGNEINVEAYTLEVRKSNEVAINLYKSLGFLVEGERKNFYEKPVENALIMWKRQERERIC